MLIPYRTDAPLAHPPIATVALIVVNVAVEVTRWRLGTSDFEPWILEYGVGLHPAQWLTSIFIHDGLLHLIGNMLYLWVFGLVVEGKVGWWRMLVIYLGIGVGESAIEQVAMLGAFGGGSLGASAAIFGLIGVAFVWAPVNEVGFVAIARRAYFFDVEIRTLGAIYLIWELVLAYLFGGGSSLLHLLGAAIGFAVGVAMVKLDLVDCQGWDLFTVWAGRQGAPLPSEEREQATAPPEPSVELAPEVRGELATQRVRHLLGQGDLDAAWRAYTEASRRLPDWRLAEPELIRLSAALQRAGRWHDSIAPMVAYLAHYRERAAHVRLKLAEVLVAHAGRPRQALRVLAKLPRERLEGPLEHARRELARRAEALVADGHLEVQTEDW